MFRQFSKLDRWALNLRFDSISFAPIPFANACQKSAAAHFGTIPYSSRHMVPAFSAQTLWPLSCARYTFSPLFLAQDFLRSPAHPALMSVCVPFLVFVIVMVSGVLQCRHWRLRCQLRVLSAVVRYCSSIFLVAACSHKVFELSFLSRALSFYRGV